MWRHHQSTFLNNFFLVLYCPAIMCYEQLSAVRSENSIITVVTLKLGDCTVNSYKFNVRRLESETSLYREMTHFTSQCFVIASNYYSHIYTNNESWNVSDSQVVALWFWNWNVVGSNPAACVIFFYFIFMGLFVLLPNEQAIENCVARSLCRYSLSGRSFGIRGILLRVHV